ncbi:hypothetical protein BDF21DRAFT_342719 [Thamnidium elegans]|nr:hypothetical protein BDF21DRAFT_342719 [Thamnidium elegans]
MEDAISQLQDLGVTRGQAKKALARYNNDVARAADFIFSGNPISDDEVEENTTESDEALAIRLSAEEEKAATSYHKITPPTDSSSWSVIPFKEPELPINTAINKTTLSTDESSLTWWKDPENPSDRIALDDLPIGLRPPSYNFAYSPVILQALFHVTAFQHAVLSFRPASHSWGAPSNYWKGFGEAVPGYVMREVVTKRQVVTHAPPKTPPAAEENLISFDDSPTQTSSDEINETINENIIQEDLPPRIVETTSPIEETVEFVDVVDNELQLMPKCLSALAEMQKLFAFLGNSKRLYGSSSHYVRALSTKLKSRNWEFNDKTFEGSIEWKMHFIN